MLQNVKSVNYNSTAVELGEAERSEFYDRFFLTICVFFMFNLTDTIGRMSSEYTHFIKPDQVKPKFLILFF